MNFLKAALLFTLLAPNLSMVDQLNEYRASHNRTPLEVNSDLNTMAKLASENPALFAKAFEPMLRLRKLPTFAYITLRTKVTPDTDLNTIAVQALTIPPVKILLGLDTDCKIGTYLAGEILFTVITCDDPKKHLRI